MPDKSIRRLVTGHVAVKLLAQDGEVYVYAQSADRVAKERAMRTRKLKWLWARLQQLTEMTLTREQLTCACRPLTVVN